LAALALVSGAAALVAAITLLIANVTDVVLGVLGVAMVLVAAWNVLTQRGVRRLLAVVALAIGAGLAIGAVVGAGSSFTTVVLRMAILVALLVVTVWSSREARRRSVAVIAAGRFRRVRAPSHPVLLCNPWSGGGKVERFGLLELAASMGLETVVLDHGLDLAQLARDAIGRGADCLGMAGGDGSQALVASIAIEHGLPFVCVSAGTRNHFALDLGFDIEDPRHCLEAFRDGLERVVDYGTVNGRLFVNNVSLGIYATIVQQEGYRESKVATSTNLLPELLGGADRPFDLQFTAAQGQEVDGAFLVQVSNNPYVLGPSLDTSQRRRLDAGSLGVFAVSATSGPDAAAAVTAVLTGHTASSRQVEQFATPRFEVRSRSGTAFAGVDGEALELPTPLDFEIHPLGLRLLVPRDNVDQAIRREAREVRLGDLLALLVHGPRPITPEPASSEEGER
jgi:diacylglycerol kinase family enzyme